MATSPYFNNINRKSEQDLHESLVIENIKISGVDVLYIPMENFEVDPILQEPKKVTFERSFKIEAYLPNNGETDGEQNLMSKFGFRVNKTVEVLISRKRFDQLDTGKMRPLEGDLIFIGDPDSPRGSFVNALFQINQVSYQSPEWPYGSHYTYKLFCETYIYNFEKFETGVPALDQFDLVGPEDNDHRVENLLVNGSNLDIEEVKKSLIKFDRHNPLTGI
ncbi:head closure Hc2 [Acidovorax phage ACP17]|uniref:Head completion, neck hetero-dimeric protein n=1 Tax=Acidovorax phage ACP17 TaxID=2010329 RepID=A0A218M2U6_9CAUD|nr:head closure Hc2 [Acidovorax phage ACP17]ASD50366.1 head completion, neck hetero-dimeric protein [Acidovorax phage ACP17]